MTPQERQLVDELFERLASLENSPRDPDAERAIVEGLRRAPNAAYALVQTALVQDEALKRAHARIEELEGGGQPDEPPRGFLDNMRDTLFGREQPRHGSVPNARTGGLGSSGVWGAGPGGPPSGPSDYGPGPGYGQQPAGYGQPPAGYGYGPGPAPGGAGGSFLGTAAASAAGVIGGAMLLNSFRSMFGQSGSGHGSSAFDAGPSTGSPWGGGNAANSDLARQAGIDNIGSSRSASRDDDSGGRAGFLGGGDEQGQTETAYDDSSDDDTDMAGDFDGDDSDNA
jgi:hypothetical protein